MKIITSYYGQLAELKEKHPDYFLVSISDWIPDEILQTVDIHDKSLAPSKDIYNEYEESKNWRKYTQRFKDERLPKVDMLDKLVEWEEKANEIGKSTDTIVLMCYEGIGDFCHRFIVAEAIEKEFNTNVKEFKYENYDKVDYRLQSLSTTFLF